MKLKVEETNIVIASIYAPNIDSPAFFVDMETKLMQLDCLNTIVGGDLNLAMNMNQDKRGLLYNNERTVKGKSN